MNEFAIMFDKPRSFFRTDVAHASGTGSRGPRARRGPRLAGPRPDQEREVWLDRARDHDEPPGEDEEYEDYAPLTAAELAEIREAAADELLAVKAATTGRRGPGQPGSARTFPGESSSPAAAFGPGMALDVLPGCAGLAVAADAAAGEDDRFAGVSEAELIGVVCAWDRVEAHAHARKLAAVAELARRNPGRLQPPDAGGMSSPPTRSPARWGSPATARRACSAWPRPWKPSCPGPRRRCADGTHLPVQGGDHRRAPPRSWTPTRPAPPSRRSWTGPPG